MGGLCWVKVAAPLSAATERIGGNSLQANVMSTRPGTTAVSPILSSSPSLHPHLYHPIRLASIVKHQSHSPDEVVSPHPSAFNRASCGPSRSGSPSPSYVPESFTPRRSTRLRLRHSQSMSARSGSFNRNCLRPDRVAGGASCGCGSDYGRVSAIRIKGRRCRACQSRLVARGRAGSRDG